jgi:hypothetical protein
VFDVWMQKQRLRERQVLRTPVRVRRTWLQSRPPMKCWNKGETHIKRARDMGHQIIMGKQKCKACGAEIEVTEKRKGWAFLPFHDKPKAN